MKVLTAQVNSDMGLHARPATKLMKEAGKFKSKIRLINGTRTADGKSMIEILKIGISFGDVITIQCDGEDEGPAAEALKNIIETSK